METPLRLQNFINGEFESCDSHIKSYNPATGEVFALVPDSGSSAVDKAVAAAKKAFPSWSSKSVSERAALLNKVADLVASHQDDFAKAESKDQGKPLWLSQQTDIYRVILNLRHFAQTAQCDLDIVAHQPDNDVINYTIHEPVGVAALIIPWNFPLFLLTFKLAPAIVYGNTVVVKPSEFTSVTAFMFCKLLKEAGIPDGVVNMVFGYGHKVGDALVKHDDVNLISFTGSTKTGYYIAEAAGSKNRKISLEMGGKNAAVVFDDADLLKCVPDLLRASFLNQGQICLCTSRIYVHRKIYSGFSEMFVKGAKELGVGDPFQEGNFMGPLCSKEHFDKVTGYIMQAKKDGLTFLLGKEQQCKLPKENQKGYFVTPVVLTDVDDDSRYMQEEIFGPLTCLNVFDDEDEVIKRVNGTKYGLCASVWSQDISKIHKVSRKLEVGTVWCNSWSVRNLHMPFGGVKMSGTAREGTVDSKEFFTAKKTVCIKY